MIKMVIISSNRTKASHLDVISLDIIHCNTRKITNYLIDKMMRLLGQGTFGKVVECYDRVKRTFCAVKIIRAIPKYRDASKIEIRVLNSLKEHDPINLK